MAHIEKYTAAATGHMLAHYDRTHSSSTSLIDESRTALNHNLAGIDQPLPQLDFLHKRLGEIKVMKRADVNVMCDWIVTAPKELSSEELPLFFNETYKFLNARYGKENVISAYVHMDETTPHIHYAFVPVVIDKKKVIPKLSAKERITRKDLKTFHTDLSDVMTKTFGRNIGIVNEATDLGNNTISQLRQASAELKEFHVEPVQEVPKAVKLFLGKDNVVISRSDLGKVNQAAFDSALIMKNAENTIKKAKDKCNKADKNYERSEQRLADADTRASKLIQSACTKAADMIIDAEKKIANKEAAFNDKVTEWETVRDSEQGKLNKLRFNLDCRSDALDIREEHIAKVDARNTEKAEELRRRENICDARSSQLDRRERELNSRSDDPFGYYNSELNKLNHTITVQNDHIRELSDKNEQDERRLNSSYTIIKNKDTEITRLRNTITEAEAAHVQEICRLTAEHDAALQKAVEDTERSVRARFEPLLEAAQAKIAELTEKINSVFCAVRDICLGVAKIGYIDDKYCVFLDKHPQHLLDAILNYGARICRKNGYGEYAKNIEECAIIEDSIREEMDKIPIEPNEIKKHDEHCL